MADTALMRRKGIKANRLSSYVFLMIVWEVLEKLGLEILLFSQP